LAAMPKQFVFPSAFAAAAVALAALFEVGVRPPVLFSLLIIVVCLLLVALFLRTPTFPAVSLYVLALYSLPFVNLVDHVVHPPEFFADQQLIWGLASNDYQRDPRIIAATALVGATGAVALSAGMFFAASYWGRVVGIQLNRPSLALPSFVFLAGAAIMLAWMRAPTATIFEVAYTQGVSPLETCGVNFNAPITAAAMFTSAIVIDLLSARGVVFGVKAVIAGIAILLVVFWYQFLHGLREAIAILPAVAILATFEPRFVRALRHPGVWVGVIAVSVVVVLAAQVIGSVRSVVAVGSAAPRVEVCPVTALIDVLSGPSSASPTPPASGATTQPVTATPVETPSPPSSAAGGTPVASPPSPLERVLSSPINLQTGTWSAVLLSPLSVVGDAERGMLAPRMGATYLDYVLSLPPSFIAQALRYERPIEPTHGPAWEMRFGLGGTHLLVVPFVNFRAPGVVLILAMFGALVAATEIAARKRPTWIRLLWLAALLIAVPRWVWYGDLYMIRAAMAFALVWVIIWLLPKTRPTEARLSTPSGQA
jgi:hypothetical protein